LKADTGIASSDTASWASWWSSTRQALNIIKRQNNDCSTNCGTGNSNGGSNNTVGSSGSSSGSGDSSTSDKIQLGVGIGVGVGVGVIGIPAAVLAALKIRDRRRARALQNSVSGDERVREQQQTALYAQQTGGQRSSDKQPVPRMAELESYRRQL
jgi:hypothetical protein